MKAAFSNWRYIFKSEDIRRKLIISLILLAVYRIVANFPVPGVDVAVLKTIKDQLAQSGGFIPIVDLLSGGTILNFSLLSMGVYPYITAQIILQLLVPIFPALQRRMEEDPREGRKWMERWTYYLAVPMALLSAIGQISIFNNITGQVVVPFGFKSTEAEPYLWLSSVAILAVMTAGTMFAIWLGELISEFGIRGQGLSLIIFAGIVSRMPANMINMMKSDDRWFNLTIIVIILVFTIAAIVFIQQGRRNVPVMYPGRRVGNRMSMPVKGSLPLLVNMAGMIPLIFAGAILQFPAIIASLVLSRPNITNEGVRSFFQGMQTLFNAGTSSSNWLYWLLYFLMVVLFTYFYADVMFMQQNYGENLKRAGAQIPGVNPGGATQRYLTKVLRRITLPGALFLGFVAVMPFLLTLAFPALGRSGGLVLVSSAGLLIVVGVVRDTFMNIDAELKLHGYQDSVLVK
jgi:preprotein translocase subunit SecY